MIDAEGNELQVGDWIVGTRGTESQRNVPQKVTNYAFGMVFTERWPYTGIEVENTRRLELDGDFL